jgi:DedD protein
MALLSFFKRSAAAPSGASGGSDGVDDVQRLRTRARQRLVGAAVLIGAGVIGFPLLFETSPRPIPVDIPIEIARKDQVPPLAMPPARQPAATPPAPARVAPVEPEAAAPSSASASAPAAAGAAAAATAPAPAPVTKPVPATPATKADKTPAPAATAKAAAAADAARARTLLEGKDAKPTAAAASGRFVVQVGAFADADAARDVRRKVEKLGFKTYTQALDTPQGPRIRVRVGPYPSRDEAEKAAAKVKSAGLPTSIVPL